MKRKKIIILSSLIGIIFFSVIYFFNDRKTYFYLKGNNIVDVNIGSEYNDEGYVALSCTKAFKMFCKNLKKQVTVVKEDKKELFKTYINYTLKYNNYNKTIVREINYVDKESPNIELIGNGIYICPNEEYIEEGYKAYDNIDGDLTDKVIVTKKNNNLFYSVSDNAGNKKIIYRSIKSNDNEDPIITLEGNEKVYLFINQEYHEKGYKAYDNCDGDITDKVVISGKIDTTSVGEYKILYTITDTSGNKSTASRTIIVYNDISTVPKNGKIVYLTFDDGPCIYTEDILKVLNKYNVKATFFVTNQFSKYQNVIKKEADDGNSVAVHTYSHNYKYIYSSLDVYLEDFNNMNNIIYEQTGYYSNLFRFPGGSSNTISRFNKGIISSIALKMTELGYHYFDWNVDSDDTRTTDANQIFNSVINSISNNEYSFVLMHDIKPANIESVDKIIEMLKQCDPCEIQEFRSIFPDLYKPGSVVDFQTEEKNTIQILLDRVKELESSDAFDKIQIIQLKWFEANLAEALRVL